MIKRNKKALLVFSLILMGAALFYLTRGKKVTKVVRPQSLKNSSKEFSQKKQNIDNNLEAMKKAIQETGRMPENPPKEDFVYVDFPKECLVDMDRLVEREYPYEKSIYSDFSKECRESLLNLFDGDKEYLEFALGACDMKEGFDIALDLTVLAEVFSSKSSPERWKDGVKGIRAQVEEESAEDFTEFKDDCKDIFGSHFEDYISYLIRHKEDVELGGTYFVDKFLGMLSDGNIKEGLYKEIQETSKDYPVMRKLGDTFFETFSPRARAAANKLMRVYILKGFSEGKIFQDTDFGEFAERFEDKELSEELEKKKKD